MSIIHDALKKVQQELNPNQTPATPPPPDQNNNPYIYDSKPALETLPSSGKTKPTIQNQIKSMALLAVALVITLACALYVWQQFQNNIPKVQTFAKKSFDTLIRKQKYFSPTPKKAEKLRPLAQLTINPATTKSSASVQTTPITLDIHGIMANTTGNVVLINNQVYQEGDVIDGTKIVKINLDSIKVSNNGVEQTIFVN